MVNVYYSVIRLGGILVNLLDMINNCTDEQLEAIIDDALNQAIASSDKKEVLGFGKDFSTFFVHKGLINPETRIKYSGYHQIIIL